MSRFFLFRPLISSNNLSFIFSQNSYWMIYSSKIILTNTKHYIYSYIFPSHLPFDSLLVMLALPFKNRSLHLLFRGERAKYYNGVLLCYIQNIDNNSILRIHLAFQFPSQFVQSNKINIPYVSWLLNLDDYVNNTIVRDQMLFFVQLPFCCITSYHSPAAYNIF